MNTDPLSEYLDALKREDCYRTERVLKENPAETTQVINKFVKAHPEFVKVGDPVLPGSRDARFDGFFAQALERKKS